MVKRKKGRVVGPGIVELSPGHWIVDGVDLEAVPYCDCTPEDRRLYMKSNRGLLGYTKRDDGVWVRPCCMRQEREAWEKRHDQPIPADYITKKEAGDG